MIKNNKMELTKYFEEVEATESYEPYFCSLGDAISIVIIGTFCGFRNLRQIHDWASHDKIKEILATEFGILRIPCYYWLTCLLKIIDPNLMADIADFVQDSDLRRTMETSMTQEKNRSRIEKRTAFVTNDIKWLRRRISGRIYAVLAQ